jgi:hypothetical protein
VAKAYERDPRNATPFNLYVDEVQNFLSGDVPEILSQCRKFGLHLTIAHQYLEQLRSSSELTYHGVMGTARNKVVFTLDNPEDADIMARRVFAGFADYELPKQSLIKPTVVGHEIIRLQSKASGRSEASSTSRSANTTASTSQGWGHVEGQSHGVSSAQSSADGLSTSILKGDELDLERHSSVDGFSSAETSSTSRSSSETFAKGTSEGQGTAEASAQGVSDTSGYSESLRPIFRELPTAVYSLEEQKHIFSDKILSLPSRTAFVVLAGEGMEMITSLDVPDITISATRRARVSKELKTHSKIHKHPKLVEKEIRERFARFMEQQEEQGIEMFDPMNPLG